MSNNDVSVLGGLSKKDQSLVISTAKRSAIIDGLLMYSDELMDGCDHFRVFVPSDSYRSSFFVPIMIVPWACTEVAMQLRTVYHAIFTGAICRSMYAIGCAVARIAFGLSLLSLPHGPMQIRLYQYPFHTLGVDYVGELPKSPSGNKWILTAVCPYSNYLRAIPVPDKTATTAAKAIFSDVFMLFGFSSVLQSDRGGEFLNALLHMLTKLLSIKQVFTSGFRPRLNGATERTHRFLNSASGIYCEHHQEQWEEYLQPAVYAHNAAPISGTNIILYII